MLSTHDGKVLLFLAICAVGFVVINFLRSDKADTKTPVKQHKKEENKEPVWTRTTEKKWSPTGWYFDEEKKKWVAPDYINAEANTKWKWDDQKRIWIDQEKKQRLDRYYEYRKREGKEPTFEEWKAQQEKQKSK